MLRSPALLAALAGSAVLACEPPPPACAAVRLMEGWACREDPAAPGGYRIQRAEPVRDCASGTCVMARPIPARG